MKLPHQRWQNPDFVEDNEVLINIYAHLGNAPGTFLLLGSSFLITAAKTVQLCDPTLNRVENLCLTVYYYNVFVFTAEVCFTLYSK